MNKHFPMLGLALALASPWAAAQTVWRCGNSYSEQPCPGGKAIDTSDPRTPGEASRAGRVANADARLAADMEKARLAQERNAPKAVLPPAAPTPAASSPRDGTRPKVGKLEQFTAVAPGGKPHKPKKKGKKQA